MNTTTIQTTTVRRLGATLLIGGLIAASAAGPCSAKSVAKGRTHRATAQPTKGASVADEGLNLILGSDYPSAAVSNSASVSNVRFQGAVGSNATAVGAPTGDSGLGVLFGSTANEVDWAAIVFSPNPALASKLAEFYTVK